MKISLMMAAAALLASCAGQPADKSHTAATPLTEGETIRLVTPARTGGKTIDEALWLRRTSREYSPEQLSLEELSGVVWAAAGINRPQDNRLTAPSALALYPIRLYVFLPAGVYVYDAVNHRLDRVVEGDHRHVAGTQDFVRTAPVNLVYIADRSVYDGRDIPAAHIDYLCGQDAAGYAENVNLYAAGHDLKAVTRGSAPKEELLALLGLDAERYGFALAQTVGK